MKKYAILIRGQSCNKIMSHKKPKFVNYKEHLDKLNQLKLNNSDCEFDIFFHTYNSKFLNEKELIEDFKPVDYIITESPIDDKNTRRAALIGKNIFFSVKSVIELYLNYIEKNKKEYDGVIMCRFDFYPYLDIKFNTINFNKINIYHIFYVKKKRRTRDNLLYTSSNNLKIYLEAMNRENPFTTNRNIGNLHWVCHYININLLNDLFDPSKYK